MIPQDLNVEEFAQALAGQAAEAFPPELPDVVKQTVTQVVYEFIKIAGNALAAEEQSYSQEDTILVCQLVGEWMYHKGIDNYKNQIPQEYWKPILQQIAFAIFETAKNGVLNQIGQDAVIGEVEQSVMGAYKGMIEQLAQEGKLSKSVDEILSQSNLQDYVEQNATQEMTPEQTERDLKLMTMAMFFKTLPVEEVGKLTKMLDENSRRQITTYLSMPDLERLVDPGLYNAYLEKFHNFMPSVQKQKRKESLLAGITSAFENISKNEFEKIIKFERKNVKNFLLRIYDGKMYEEDLFSSDVSNMIINYATQKVGSR